MTAVNEAKKGGFTGTGRTNQGHKLPWLHVQVHVPENLLGTETDSQILQDEAGRDC
ncbi:hypothetical protein GCM10009636_04970 [Arthrobacter koreensis]